MTAAIRRQRSFISSRYITSLALALFALGSGAFASTPERGTGALPPHTTQHLTQHLTQHRADPPLVFDGVTIIDVQDGQHHADQRLVITDNRITAIGSASDVPVPSGARVIDAHGKYVIPGLWDMHTHSLHYTDIAYPLLLANGVTGFRDAWSSVPLDSQIQWRKEILNGTRLGPPRQILSGPALDEGEPNTGHLGVTGPADARRVVDSLKAAGSDMIKTYDLQRPETYFAIASEARRIGIPFGGHVWYNVLELTAAQVSDSGARILDHGNTAGDLDSLCLAIPATLEHCQPIAALLRKNGTYFVPTFIRLASGYSVEQAWDGRVRFARPSYGLSSQGMVRHFFSDFSPKFWDGDALMLTGLREAATAAEPPPPHPRSPSDTGRALSLAHLAGLPILAGTDFAPDVMPVQPPGFSLLVELATYVEEGLTPLEALQTATLNPAKVINATDSLGTVAVGKLADFVVLDADPLQDMTNLTKIRAVVANGRYFDRPELDKILTDVKQKKATLAGYHL